MKASSPIDFSGTEKSVRTVTNLFTVNNVAIVPDIKKSVLSWNAVMVDVPGPTMETVVPSIVATDAFELV